MSEQKTRGTSIATWVLLGILITGAFSVVLFFILDAVRANTQPSSAAIVQEGSEDSYTGLVIDPPITLADFTLTDQNGSPFQLNSLRGRAVLMFFGYTHCPDYCPTTLHDFTRVKELLGDAANDVAFVFISVDGERDTPEVIANFIDLFDSSFIGLTGTPEEVLQIGEPFGITVERVPVESSLGYSVTHTVAMFILDREGRWVRRISYATAPDVVAEQLRSVLAQ